MPLEISIRKRWPIVRYSYNMNVRIIRKYSPIVILLAVLFPIPIFGEESLGSGMNTSGLALDIENTQVLKTEIGIIPRRIMAFLEDGTPTWYLRDDHAQYRRLQLIDDELLSIPVNEIPEKMIQDDHKPPVENGNRIWQFSGGSLTISRQGQFTLEKDDGRIVAQGQTIPDAKPVFTEGYLALLTEPSNIYQHGILGDLEEPRSFIVYQIGSGRMFTPDPLPAGTVYEARYPILADVDKDGYPELFVTTSNASDGASIHVYSHDAKLKASSLPIGRGFRWLHLLGISAASPDGGLEIIAVRTPHLGGVLEFYRMEGAVLEKVHTAPGYSTHQIRSRNLDMAAIGNFGSGGAQAVLLPVQDYSRIVTVQRDDIGSRVLRSFSLDGRLSTNMALLDYGDTLIVTWGTDKGIITILKEQR